MSRRQRKSRIVEHVKITDIAAGGKGVGHEGSGRAIMVDYALPGDVVTAFLYKDKKAYGLGNIEHLEVASELRKESFCAHFGTCGGCRWQHVSYKNQLKFKSKIVKDAFQRIGKMELPEIQPIKGAESVMNYRNKLEFSFSNNRWLSKEQIGSRQHFDKERALGFHVPRFFDKIVDIEYCHLQEGISNDIRNSVRDFAIKKNYSFYDLRKNTGFLRNLIVRNTSIGQWMVILSVGEHNANQIEEIMAFLDEKFPAITSLYYVINTKGNNTILDQEIIKYSGATHIEEKIGDVRFLISPKSFFQTNTAQCKVLYDETLALANIGKEDVVYDLFTGTGSIANYLAKSCKKVIGIEVVEEAIEDAKKNAELNGNENTIFVAGTVEALFKEELLAKHGQPDVIIVDPPRAGMHEKVIKQLLALACKKIVYISCNPATQARDIALLGDKYKITAMQPVDLFPHTYHVENIACLELH